MIALAFIAFLVFIICLPTIIRRTQTQPRQYTQTRTDIDERLARIKNTLNESIDVMKSAKPIECVKEYDNTLNPLLDNMDGFDFEIYCKDILKQKYGYEAENPGKGGSDHGVDLLFDHDTLGRYGIQCKRWTGNVGNKVIQEIYTGGRFNKCNSLCIITTSKLTRQAQIEAQELDIAVIDKDNFKEFVDGNINFRSIRQRQYNES